MFFLKLHEVRVTVRRKPIDDKSVNSTKNTFSVKKHLVSITHRNIKNFFKNINLTLNKTQKYLDNSKIIKERKFAAKIPESSFINRHELPHLLIPKKKSKNIEKSVLLNESTSSRLNIISRGILSEQPKSPENHFI